MVSSLALAGILLVLQPSFSGASSAVSGVILDPLGSPVAGATIVSTVDRRCAATSNDDGRFVLPCEDRDAALRVTAPGFRPIEIALADGATGSLTIVLQPTPHTEMVVVTATRAGDRVISRAAPVSTLAAGDLALAPPVPLDDLLRSVPGFSLFRRSSSRVSNPTTHGATLRGLSASGAGRALVLADGLPLNDPFGGWVSWNRVPHTSVERVEVVRGGASDLYGADALAGVVQVLTVRPSAPILRAEITAGTRRTGRASAFGGTERGGWDVSLAAEASTTDGYVLVPEEARGAVDVASGGSYATARGGAGYRGRGWDLRAAGHLFAEARENGTPLQTNEADAWQARLDAGGEAAGGRWRARLHAADQTYEQTFSAVAAGRSTETLTLQQRVPASERGVSAEWSRTSDRADLLAGGDVRQTSATNEEQGFLPDGRRRAPTSTPAFQRTGGVFAQATYRARDDVTVTLGARGDLRERDRASALSDADTKLSPRATAAWTAAPWLAVRASAAWSYRAPTLNERYRGFRVGSVVTLPNADLRPERLRTIEGGVFLAPRHGSFRATVFRSDLEDGVANVTVTTTSELITRRRENVGGIKVWGAELEGEWRLTRTLALTGASAFLDSRFVDDPQLNDLRVPQVPRWHAAAGVRWLAPHQADIGAQLRVFSRQFEDDRNTLTLDGGAVLDVTVVRPIGRGASVLVSVENLLNTTYDVGRTPTRTVGLPFTAHAGVRFDLGRARP